MKAVVVHAAGDLRVEDLPVPSAGPGEVLIGVEWGGICGSDVAYWRHGASGTATLKHPMVLGHEFAGRVVELGQGVEGIELGAAVTIYPPVLVGDGVLPNRLAGRTNLYPSVRYYGSAAANPHTDGGFCEFKTVLAEQVLALPDGIDTRRGALAEPLGVAFHAVARAAAVGAPVRGADILVNGTGPIGALVIAAAKYSGARQIIAADVADPALAVAVAVGADRVVNVGREPLPDDVPLVFEVSGVGGALGSVLRATARGGTLVQVGNLSASPVAAALGDLVTREITWAGSFRFIDEMSLALRALAEGVFIDPVMTHTFSINEAERAFEVAADRSTGSGKVMLDIAQPHVAEAIIRDGAK